MLCININNAFKNIYRIKYHKIIKDYVDGVLGTKKSFLIKIITPHWITTLLNR